MATQERLTHGVHGVALVVDKLNLAVSVNRLGLSDLFEHFKWHDITPCTSVQFQLCTSAIDSHSDKSLLWRCWRTVINCFDYVQLLTSRWLGVDISGVSEVIFISR